MDFLKLGNSVQKFALDNSPAILTGIGAAGTVVTAVLSFRAGKRIGADIAYLKVAEDIAAKDPNGPEIPDVTDPKVFVYRYWTEFAPPVAMGALTLTSIIGAHRIGSRRAAAIAAAYSLSEKAFAEYKEKVVEKIGEKKNNSIRDEIATEKVLKDPHYTKEVVKTGAGEVMCYDTITGRYFLSSRETIKRAENEINKQILYYDYASLSDFYDKLGLGATSMSEEVGWKFGNQLDIYFTSVLADDGTPCLAMNYTMEPVRNYYKMQ